MKNKFFVTIIFIVACLKLWNADAKASTPWEWELTLQEVKQGAAMNLPSAIYIDEESERYYVVDSGNNRLLAYSRTGDFISGFTANNNLLTPFDVVRQPGMLWVVEKGRNSVTIIDLKNRKVTPKTINHKGRDIYPDRIELFGDNLYLLDKASGNIFGLNKQVEIMKSFQCENCTGGFVDFKLKNGKLWALEQSSKAVFVFSLDGRLESKIQLDSSEINFPRSLAIDDNNLFYVLDRHQGTIVVFDSQGNYKYNFLAAGGARGQIYYPVELKFDPWGQLCVVEEGNGRVQIFSHK
jgi:DNA-binding beta-propeller fold protein YncE